MNPKTTGFTLIELIMVIVILAILAAFAIPKVSDLDSEARRAARDGLLANIKSGARIAHASCLADSGCNAGDASSSTVVESASITMTYGYPEANATGMVNMIDMDGSIVPTYGTAPDIITFTISSGCTITYSEPLSAATPPSYGGSCN